MQYRFFFFSKKKKKKKGKFQMKNFDFFTQNKDNGHTLEPSQVLTSTHDLCFGAKNKKNKYTLHTPVLLYKSGGIRVILMCLCKVLKY